MPSIVTGFAVPTLIVLPKVMLIVVSPLACVIAALILLPSPLIVTLEPNRLFLGPPVLASKLRPLSIVSLLNLIAS